MLKKLEANELRQAAGRFATGITVVTTHCDGEVRGMTANSFVSVSLEPPLVLVSVANSASMLKQIQESGTYGVSVLRDEQKDLSGLFAGAKIEGLSPDFKVLSGISVLENSLAVFSCDLYQEVQCGDHTLLVGKVRALEYCDADPLIYFASSYQEINKVA